MNKDEQMIYVHIPFCGSKCYYCSFSSFSDMKFSDKYFDYLNKEIIKRKTDKKISSIYIGGGTPSCVDSKFIVQIIKTICANYNILPNCEISIECNPNSATFEKLKDYFESGINRISFGVQSLDEKQLEKMGRNQTNEQVMDCIRMANKIGYKSISVDLLIGLENQTFNIVKNNIDILNNAGIHHISLYMLIVEPNTLLEEMVRRKQYLLPNEDDVVILYSKITKYLKNKGFKQYEVSNFAKNNKICHHNLGYWQMKEYLGFGLASHSFYNNCRRANSTSFEGYFNDDYQNEICDQQSLYEEKIMLGLRTSFGINKQIITNKSQMNWLIANKFLEEIGDYIRVKQDKLGVLNQIILKLI